ncbi:hypothetical protein DS745_21460 [Anaerobacillus alkaliphilus]|uniref:Uncharacterized protein n=1 Tax=Anaerobacillus alkaliphilus TaxID=1548597 RepID=A0A4Q0VLH3_9BACI|nr:hypothetical protein [Anaerobacillus alkaliphilus]RXI96301.1 hypothetical protein DS745_21460 [Anaerobacillus alkaliphilus]
MENFINFFNSINIVNMATILSVILAVVFFTYQEYKRRREQQKEILQLKDQIINLVIRNHVNSGVTITKIDLESFVEGFEKLKNCKLRLQIEDIAKMIYAKVYENEHIPSDTRLELLKHVEELIVELKYRITTEREGEIEPLSLNITRISTSLMIFIFIITIQFLNPVTDISDLGNFYIGVIISLTIFTLVFLKPLLDRFIDFIVDLSLHTLSLKKAKVPLGKTKPEFKVSLTGVAPTSADEKIKFDDFFTDNKEIRKILEQRVLMESLLRQIYYVVTNENTSIPVHRITTSLVEKEIIAIGLSNEIKMSYRLSSFVIHEGKLPSEVNGYNQLIDNMENISNFLYKILMNYKNEKNSA